MTDNSVNQNESEKQDVITLKWGSLKAWDIQSDRAVTVFNKVRSLPISVMGRYNLEQALWLIELIESSNCETIHLDWDGIDVSKDEAIVYVRKANDVLHTEGT